MDLFTIVTFGVAENDFFLASLVKCYLCSDWFMGPVLQSFRLISGYQPPLMSTSHTGCIHVKTKTKDAHAKNLASGQK